MAEADVEDPSQLKFYCHQCKKRFGTVLFNFTCPRCSLGFVEEVEVKPEPKQDDPVPTYDNNEEHHNMLRHGDFYDHSLQPDAFEMRGGNDRNRSSNPGSNQRRSGVIHPGISRRGVTRFTAARYGTPFENRTPEVVSDFATAPDLIGGSGNMEDFMGDEDLNTVITGPPPVSKKVIDNLEIVEVTPVHVSTQLKCAICLENYVLGEPVRQLLCGHNYHDTCIRTWLLIHGTCAMCRKYVTENETTVDELSTSNAASDIEALNTIFWEVNMSNSPSNSTTTRGSHSSTSSNSSSRNRDPRM